MFIKDQVLKFKNFLLQEKLEADNFTVYHRTGKAFSNVKSIDCTNGTVTPDDFGKGFKVGGGAYHGAGIYTTQDLKDQMSDSMRNTYGPIIIEYKVKNTGKFILLDYDAQKKLKSMKSTIFNDIPGSAPKEGKPWGLKAQLRKILGGKYNKIYNFSKEYIDEWDYELDSKGKGTRNADIGNNLMRLPGILGNVDGFVYTGLVDGNCVLIYDSGLAQAVRWTEVPGPEWPKEDEIQWNKIKQSTNKDTVKGYIFKSDKSGILFNKGKTGDKVSVFPEGGKDKDFVKIIGKVPSDKQDEYGVGISEDLAKKIGFKEGGNVTIGWKGNVFRKTKLQNQIDYADEFLTGFDILEVILSKDETDDAAEDYEKLVKSAKKLGYKYIFDSILLNGEKKVKQHKNEIIEFFKEGFGGFSDESYFSGSTLKVLFWVYGAQYIKKVLTTSTSKLDSRTIIGFIFIDLGMSENEVLMNLINKTDRLSEDVVSTFSEEEKIQLYKNCKDVIFSFFVRGEFLSKGNNNSNNSVSIIAGALKSVQEYAVTAFLKKYPSLGREMESLFLEIPNLQFQEINYITKFVTDKKQLKSIISKATESTEVYGRLFKKFCDKLGIKSSDELTKDNYSFDNNKILLFEEVEQSEGIENILSTEELEDYLSRGPRLLEASMTSSFITDEVKRMILEKSTKLREALKNWLNRDNEKEGLITSEESKYDLLDIENTYKQFLTYNFNTDSYRVLIDFHLKNFDKEVFFKNFWNKDRCVEFVRLTIPSDYSSTFGKEFMTNELRKETYSASKDYMKDYPDYVLNEFIRFSDDDLFRQTIKEGLAKTSLFKDIFESESLDVFLSEILNFFKIYYDSPGIIKKIYKILNKVTDWDTERGMTVKRHIFVTIEKFQGLVSEGKTEKNESVLSIIPFKHFINESELYKSTLKGGESAKNSFLVKLFYVLFSIEKAKFNKMFASPEEMFDFCKEGKLSEMLITRTQEYKKKLVELEKSKKEAESEANKQRDEEYDERQSNLSKIMSDGEMLKIIHHLNNSGLLFAMDKNYPLGTDGGSSNIKPWYTIIDILRLATLYSIDKGQRTKWTDTLEVMEYDLKEYQKDGAIVSKKFPQAKTIEELVNLYAKSLEFIIPLTSGVIFKVKDYIRKLI